ncbi:predicted protein [Chaetomium globosum CBS 148.51]|uniref:Uncharacterized protein n=1 Tax=Chaetomium globosum (strain ATCC 6205 / CBS 148.51 / DSM 1962 / NBRC 6347 / NRRL 1970) TaxID=306901 RepID=Q2H2D6_CHAGB|nr:uncharacterized protein CHGG_04060 [Chaetomium globosum CBS 148.51]EAQ87441.1 predicted protein [Chaetomium globosum CBS 148.51]
MYFYRLFIRFSLRLTEFLDLRPTNSTYTHDVKKEYGCISAPCRLRTALCDVTKHGPSAARHRAASSPYAAALSHLVPESRNGRVVRSPMGKPRRSLPSEAKINFIV